MAAVLTSTPHAATKEAPVLIVGSGPAGMRVAQELLRRCLGRPIVLCGAEMYQPYSRVGLSSFLMGEIGLEELNRDSLLPPGADVTRLLGCPIVAIDRAARRAADARGRMHEYSQLVLAIGSSPHVPNIPGIDLPGVFTFRDFRDAEQLFARRMRSRHTVVLGGGLLGLEAARAMRRFQTKVTVIEHNNRLMPRQLDAGAAAVVRRHIEKMGIDVVLNDGARVVEGATRVDGVRLQSGERVNCDTVVVATGIRPNVELARKAGLHVGRGIRIDDETRTSDPNIFAVGECTEHRDVVYGLVAPAFEQASVAAANIAGTRAQYPGSTAATRLKVVGLPVFSVGDAAEENRGRSRSWHYRDGEGTYAAIRTDQHRLTGAIVIGHHDEVGRLQEAVKQRRVLWPWQLWRFRRRGYLWPETSASNVAAWPDSVTVCNCTGVTRGQLAKAIGPGCATVADLTACTGAGSVCGSCRPLLQQLLGGVEKLLPVRGARMLVILGGLTAILVVLIAMPWNLPDAASVQVRLRLSTLWRDPLLKQVSGYSLLGLSALTLLLSLRKRVARFRWADFASWRVAHTALGALTILALLLHTGGRLGSNLNLALAASFTGLIAAGGASSLLVAGEHRLGAAATTVRRSSVWAHILLFWPVPVLLSFHILQAYFF